MKKSVIAAGLLIAGLAGSAAHAHQWGCWIQRDRNIAIRNAAGSQASSAIGDWNSMTILNFTSVSSGEEIYVFNANSGATGWAGLARITSYSGCTIYRATAQVNTYYYSSTSTAARGIHCQEIGHGFGLDHSNDGGCMGAGYWYSVTGAYRPVSHNVNDVGSMYANRISGSSLLTGEHNDDGHGGHGEEDSPRLHAYWMNNPRHIGETAQMASDIVVATVTGVTDGDDIISRAEGDTYESRIPTQRVHFTIEGTTKGDMVKGESFVLFQNGNDKNRFDEDPSYKVGARYLMFLTPREDGTYLVVSPEGRYQLGGKGLIPASHRGFAAELKGARLSDVLGDVQRAIQEQ
ncbi:MAG: hypothetical protein ACLGI9_01715 [Thermoanaerobaculia bacterium]